MYRVTKIVAVARVGPSNGRMMVKKIRIGLAPSTRAASSSDTGMVRMKPVTKKITVDM